MRNFQHTLKLKGIYSIKHLWVQINSNLKWKEHISAKVSESSRTLGAVENAYFRLKAIAYKIMLLRYNSLASILAAAFCGGKVHEKDTVL